MADVFTHNAAAILALVGVLVGGSLSFLNAWAMRNRDFNLKVWEKFLDRRITAHEKVVQLALRMRVMVSFEKFDASGELTRTPEVMMSKRAFERWLRELALNSLPATTWLSTAVKKELYFIGSSGKFVGYGERQRGVSVRNRRNLRQVESNDVC